MEVKTEMQFEFRNKNEETYLVVTYDQENNWLYNRWIGYASETDIKKGAESFFKGPTQGKIRQILNDNRDQAGPWEKVNDWLQHDWMPQAAEAGLKQFAHVVAPGILSALSAQDLHRRMGLAVEMKIFADIESARNWLKKCQQQNLKK